MIIHRNLEMEFDMFLDHIVSNQSIQDSQSFEISSFIVPHAKNDDNINEENIANGNNTQSNVELVRPILTPKTLLNRNSSFNQPLQFSRTSSQQQISSRSLTLETLLEGNEMPTFNPVITSNNNKNDLLKQRESISDINDVVIVDNISMTNDQLAKQIEASTNQQIELVQNNDEKLIGDQSIKNQQRKQLEIIVNNPQSSFDLIRPIFSPKSQQVDSNPKIPKFSISSKMQEGKQYPQFNPINPHVQNGNIKQVNNLTQEIFKNSSIELIDNISSSESFKKSNSSINQLPQPENLNTPFVPTIQEVQPLNSNMQTLSSNLSPPKYVEPQLPVFNRLATLKSTSPALLQCSINVIDVQPLHQRTTTGPTPNNSLFSYNDEVDQINNLHNQISTFTNKIAELSQVSKFSFGSKNASKCSEISALQEKFDQFSEETKNVELENKLLIRKIKAGKNGTSEKEAFYKKIYENLKLEIEEKVEAKSQIQHDFHISMRKKNQLILQLQQQIESNQ